MTNFVKFFTTAKSGHVTLTDNAPEWLRDAVYDAHGDMLPNDWVFDICMDAVSSYDSGDLTEESVFSWADSRVDVYTKELFQWAADFCLSGLYSDAESKVRDDCSSRRDGWLNPSDAFMRIQCYVLESIAQTMLAACEKAEQVEE